MALVAKRNQIVQPEPVAGMPSPRFLVMRMKHIAAGVGVSATLALVAVSLIHSPYKGFPSCGCVHPLPLWTAAINEAGIESPVSSKHAVAFAAKVRLCYGRLAAQDRLCFFRVPFSRKRICRTRLLHEVVRALEIQAAWTSRDAKGDQLFVHALRIAAHHPGDVVSRKTIDGVLLKQPISV